MGLKNKMDLGLGHTHTSFAWRSFDLLDQLRRSRGRLMDSLNLGPQETPSRTVYAEKGFSLVTYPDTTDQQPGAVLLIVPAPIKQAYIWDLTPTTSVVRHCLDRNLGVFMVKWASPEGLPPSGLAAYADRFIAHCLQAIERETGQSRVFIAGHSLGGTFSAIFAALHPEHTKGLVVLGAPLHFSKETGEQLPGRRSCIQS